MESLNEIKAEGKGVLMESLNEIKVEGKGVLLEYLNEIKVWLDHFQSEVNSLPLDDTTLRPKYSLLCRRLAFARRTIDIHKNLDGDLPDKFNDLRRNIQSIRDASTGSGSGSGSDSLPAILRPLLQELHKLNGMLSLKASAFSDAYPHHREATINPTFHIEGDPFEEVYKDQDPCLNSCASVDFLQLFEDLNLTGKYFLMCFSVFPADTVVDKRTLAYWCMGMGVLQPSETQVERVVDMILQELVLKGFVEAEKKNFKLVGFKVCPLVRCFAVKVAERFGFYVFNDKGEPSFHGEEPRIVFLSRASMSSSLDNLLAMSDDRLQKVECILNVNEPYPDFDLLQFGKMKNLNTLCLGRSSTDQHIELHSLDFLSGLKVLKKITILSLRGISQVFRLPDALCKHAHLRVLDLNSCHNLEVLPEEIRLLENLTHLDISKCYLLDRMPKGLASLTELRVLKGFLVVEYEASCDFASLTSLKKLSKMSLYVHKIDFPNDNEQSVFQEFSLLRDFTIQWGGKAVTRKLGLHAKVEKPRTDLEEVIIKPGGSASSTTLSSLREIGSGDKAGAISPSRRSDGIETTEEVEVLEGGQHVATEDPNDDQAAKKVRNADQSKPFMKRIISRLPIQIKKDLAGKVTASDAKLGAVEKLVLQCYPQEEMPAWLVPSDVPRLKQLHIKGGKLRGFGIAWRDGKSKLEMLRLNYLKELEMDMEDLRTYFPELNWLAKAECPKLSGFPADGGNIRLPPRDGS